jgi:CBS domain-containing protein
MDILTKQRLKEPDMPLFGELFVSEILRKPVLDPKGEELGRLGDICIVKAEPLPKVDFLIIRKGKARFKIPWGDIGIFNKKIISSKTYAASLIPYEPGDEDLLIVRDILDKQIVDVNGVKVVRANDIKLEGYDLDAMLVAVDVGVRGILRRLGFERGGEDILRVFRARMPYNLISWNYIQPLHPKISAIALTVPRQMVSEIHPADLAELISQVSRAEGAHLFKGLDVETAAEALSELQPETQAEMINAMDADRAADIIEEMPPDDAADVLADLSAEKAKEILEHIEKEEAEDIQELLGHEEDSAGGLMTTEYISYPSLITVGEVMERFKKDAEDIETVYYIYIVDDEKLVGVLSLKELLLSGPELKIADIMETKIKTAGPEEDDGKVAEIISKYNLVALPVVDSEGFMLGIVTVDDILDRVLPAQTRRKRTA